MIYFIQCGENGPIKIGQSEDPLKRIEQLQIANSYELKLIWIYRNKENDDWTEKQIHSKFKAYKIRGEWFYPSADIFNRNVID